MDISIRKFWIGPRFSYVAAIEFCSTLKETNKRQQPKGQAKVRCVLTVAILHQSEQQTASTWQSRRCRSGSFDYPKFVSPASATFLRYRTQSTILCEREKSLLKSVTKTSLAGIFLLAFFFRVFALVRAEEKLSVEQLNGNDGEYKLKQYVHDQDVDDVL